MIRLMDLCSKIGSGATPKGGKNAYLGGEYALIRSQNVLHNDFSNEGLVFINEDQAKNLENVSVEKDDVLLNITGDSVARCCNVPKEVLPARVNQHVMIIRTNSNELCPYYLKYYLISRQLQSFLLTLASAGATRNALTKSMIENLEIKIPDITVQKSISSFLRKFDKKIQKNRQENETLEEISKALFKSWFIDFDPVRAKAEGRTTGLSKEISDLFPDSFEDSELGEIPSGWKIEKLGHHINLTKGKSYRSAELQESDSALVTLKSFQRNGGYREDGLKEYIGSYKDEQIVSDGDLIVAFTDVTQAADVIGKPAIVIGNPNYSRLVISLDVGVIRVVPESVLTNAFIYFLMLSNRYASNSLGYTNGTNVLHLKKEAITEYDFCLPNNNSLLKIYNDISKNMLEKVSKNSLENITLEKLRDTLLPKLISGELKIPDAENIVKEAGI
jgi:type I restriction enzyme, S subunit